MAQSPQSRKSRKGSLSPPSLSPPTYSVESDGKGNLISCKYRINWPKRPTEGKHSIQAEMELRVGMPKSAGNSKTTLDRGRRSSEQVAERSVVGQNQELIKKYHIAVCPDESSTVYSIRTMSMEQATRKFEELQKQNFMIYYQLPAGNEYGIGIDKLPLEVPLMIASKNARGQILHYQIKCYSCKDASGSEDLWCAVRLDSCGAPVKEPYRYGFADVRALLEYWSQMNAECALKSH